MRIALCDDDAAALALLKNHISAYFSKGTLTVQFDCFSSGEDFLSTSQPYDIVFMDIYLSGISGIEAVRKYRTDNKSHVVFTTSSREHAVEAFGLNAAHYLIKPPTAENVAEALGRCLSRMNTLPEKILEVKTPGGIVPIPMREIVYIEVFDKVSIVHTEQDELRTYKSLDAICELLDRHDFLRVQRSFVVNMHCVESFLSDRVVLKNEVEIVLARSNRQALRGEYQRFLFQLARKGTR